MAYVSVYTGRFREINRVSIIYGLIFVAIFVGLHLLVRVLLPQADAFLLPITALLAAVGLTEIFRIRPSLALTQGQWLLVGAVLFVLTVLVVRDHARLDRYRYLIGGSRPGPAGRHDRVRHHRERLQAVDPRLRHVDPAVGVRQARHRRSSWPAT